MLLSAGPTWAGEQTVTLAVDNLFRTSCPYIVKRTLANVPGVSDSERTAEAVRGIAGKRLTYRRAGQRAIS